MNPRDLHIFGTFCVEEERENNLEMALAHQEYAKWYDSTSRIVGCSADPEKNSYRNELRTLLPSVLVKQLSYRRILINRILVLLGQLKCYTYFRHGRKHSQWQLDRWNLFSQFGCLLFGIH